MMCPYQGFKKCDWDNCAAKKYAKSPIYPYGYIKVCALAYSEAPISTSTKEDQDEN